MLTIIPWRVFAPAVGRAGEATEIKREGLLLAFSWQCGQDRLTYRKNISKNSA